MPARDIYHAAAKAALVTDGWTVTAEDYTIPVGRQRIYIDVQAEDDLITAFQGSEKIAVEVKSFISTSAVKNLRDAVGQYVLYRSVLRRLDPERVPYLAIDAETVQTLFSEPLAEYLVSDEQVRRILSIIAGLSRRAERPGASARQFARQARASSRGRPIGHAGSGTAPRQASQPSPR